METHTLFLACVEDWQGAYIDGKLVDEGHEVNLIDIINEFQFFLKAEYKYLSFNSEREFLRFLHLNNGGMPKKLADLKDWL